MQAVLDAISEGKINALPVLVISSSERAFALERAKVERIPSYTLMKRDFASFEKRDERILELLKQYSADLVILAGYLGILSPFVVDEFPDRIINIHPALLPKFGGKGFHGLNVHRAVLAAGETESGATVHFVDAGTDTGRIIGQRKVAVLPGDTPEVLAARVLQNAEHPLLVSVVKDICEGRIS